MLIVELDGPFHAAREDYDAKCNAFLERFGYRVWRFSNSDMAGDWVTVLQSIAHELTASSPQPLSSEIGIPPPDLLSVFALCRTEIFSALAQPAIDSAFHDLIS